MVKARALLIAAPVSGSTLMCSGRERVFSGNDMPENSAGEAGEASEGGAGGRRAGESAGEGGALDSSGGAAGSETSDGESSAGDAGASSGDVSGAAGDSSSAGGAGATNGGTAGATDANGGTGGTAGAIAAGGGSAGSAECPSASSQCVPVAPAGWQGPLLVTADSGSSCPAEFPAKSPVFHSGLVPGSANCVCNCGSPRVSCGGSASFAVSPLDANCARVSGANAVTEGMCEPLTSSVFGGSVEVSYRGQISATCNAAAVQASLPVPSWTQSLNACSGAKPLGTCSAANQVCLAKPSAPFAAKYCVAQDGEQTCPTAYSVRSLLFAGYQDTRACPSSCSCTASGQDCALQLDVHGQTDCTGSSTRRTVLSGRSTCVPFSSSARAYVAARVVTNPGTCSANSALSPTGSVTESGPTTLCCTQ